MDAALRQSKAMCPFMKKATAARLRAMTTAARPAAAPAASPCGGAISKLQVLARRCPVMGKAMAVQSARLGHAGIPGGVAALSTRSGPAKACKANLHTSRAQEAQAVEGSLFRDKGECDNDSKCEYWSIGIADLFASQSSFPRKSRSSRSSTRLKLPEQRHRSLPARLTAPSSITMASTTPSWRRSTRTSRTATSTTSTVWPRSSRVPTWRARRKR